MLRAALSSGTELIEPVIAKNAIAKKYDDQSIEDGRIYNDWVLLDVMVECRARLKLRHEPSKEQYLYSEPFRVN